MKIEPKAGITLIACIQEDGGIGYKGDLIWKIPMDMFIFKTFTTGNTVVMGANTFKSLGSKPLKNRRNIVLSHEEIDVEGVEVCHSFEELDKFLASIKGEIFIIGGASLYNYYVDKCDRAIITQVDAPVRQADTFFPKKPAHLTHEEFIAECNLGVRCETYEFSTKDDPRRIAE